jgi:hypothetical protein
LVVMVDVDVSNCRRDMIDCREKASVVFVIDVVVDHTRNNRETRLVRNMVWNNGQMGEGAGRLVVVVGCRGTH